MKGNSEYKRIKLGFIRIFLILLITIFSLTNGYLFNKVHIGLSFLEQKNNDDETVHREEIVFSDVTHSISTYGYPKGTTIYCNYTVLLQSNSSVQFYYYASWHDQSYFSPEPLNFTLIPGQSYAKDFTVINQMASWGAILEYYAVAIIDNSNATVHYWWSVQKQGNISLPGIAFTFSGIILISISVLSFKKRKK